MEEGHTALISLRDQIMLQATRCEAGLSTLQGQMEQNRLQILAMQEAVVDIRKGLSEQQKIQQKLEPADLLADLRKELGCMQMTQMRALLSHSSREVTALVEATHADLKEGLRQEIHTICKDEVTRFRPEIRVLKSTVVDLATCLHDISSKLAGFQQAQINVLHTLMASSKCYGAECIQGRHDGTCKLEEHNSDRPAKCGPPRAESMHPCECVAALEEQVAGPEDVQVASEAAERQADEGPHSASVSANAEQLIPLSARIHGLELHKPFAGHPTQTLPDAASQRQSCNGTTAIVSPVQLCAGLHGNQGASRKVPHTHGLAREAAVGRVAAFPGTAMATHLVPQSNIVLDSQGQTVSLPANVGEPFVAEGGGMVKEVTCYNDGRIRRAGGRHPGSLGFRGAPGGEGQGMEASSSAGPWHITQNAPGSAGVVLTAAQTLVQRVTHHAAPNLQQHVQHRGQGSMVQRMSSAPGSICGSRTAHSLTPRVPNPMVHVCLSGPAKAISEFSATPLETCLPRRVQLACSVQGHPQRFQDALSYEIGMPHEFIGGLLAKNQQLGRSAQARCSSSDPADATVSTLQHSASPLQRTPAVMQGVADVWGRNQPPALADGAGQLVREERTVHL